MAAPRPKEGVGRLATTPASSSSCAPEGGHTRKPFIEAVSFMCVRPTLNARPRDWLRRGDVQLEEDCGTSY